NASFDTLLLPPPRIPRLPSADSLLAEMERHPERLAAAAEAALGVARVREARAARVPDLTVQAGVRHFAENGAHGFLAGVSLPIPLWNTHGGLVGEAEAERNAARIHEQAVRRRLETELRGAYDRLYAARDRYDEARARLLPATREALAQLQRGYRAGRFTYQDQLEGQRAAV